MQGEVRSFTIKTGAGGMYPRSLLKHLCRKKYTGGYIFLVFGMARQCIFIMIISNKASVQNISLWNLKWQDIASLRHELNIRVISKLFFIVVVKTKQPITKLLISNISTVFNYVCLAIANKIYLWKQQRLITFSTSYDRLQSRI